MDTTSFEDGAKKATSQLESFGASFNKALGAAAVIAAFAALTAGIVKTINNLDTLGKSAQKIGLPVEELSALKYAANLADVSTESLTTGMERLAKNMSAVAGGAKGPATEAFKALNISVTDSNGVLKSSSDILGELADKFSSFKDSAAKTALAIAIFGRGGAELIPLLNEGSKGLKSSADEAARFGLIVDSQATKAAQDFNDNLKRLGAVMEGVMIKVTSGLSDELVRLSASLVDVANNGTTTQVISDAIAVSLRAFAVAAVVVTTDLAALAGTIKLLIDVSSAIKNGDFGKLPDIMISYKDAAVAAGTQSLETIKNLIGLGSSAQPVVDEFGKLVSALDNLGKQKADAPILATKTALDHFIDSTNKSIAAQKAEFDTFGLAAGAREKAKFLLEAESVAKANDITITGKQKVAIDALAVSLELINQKLAGQQLTLELSPWLQYQKDLTNTQVLLQTFSIDLDTFTKKSQLLAANLSIAYATTFNNIAQNAANAFRDIAALNHNYATAAKAAAIAQATIATYLGAAQAYTQALPFGGPPLAAIAAAVAVAAGLANVAKIAATPFATGGSFKVGGSGGIDSQLVTIAATPGEMVDVRRPGQSMSNGNEITVRGIGPRDLFTGSMLRDLFDALNQGQRDGYKLKFAE
jgi:hypothetical protein